MKQKEIIELKCQEWLDAIILRYYDIIKKTAYHTACGYRISNPLDWAEDITQEVFLCLCRRSEEERIRNHENIAGWLFVTLEHIIGNERQKAYHREIPVADVWESVPEESYELECTELFPSELSKEEQQLLFWCRVHGLPVKVVAKHLNCSEPACRMRLRRAEEHFRKSKNNLLYSTDFDCKRQKNPSTISEGGVQYV